jgi:PAS domain S-box-containing protein
MEETLHVLFVEDSPEDVALVIRNLRLGGYHIESERVESATGLTAALDRQSWDLIICDYKLPRFSGFEALRMLRERDQDTPFIFVSGSLGEDAAVSALKQGAQDYLLKDKLKRLVPAVEREIRESRERARFRAEHARNEAALRASEAKFRALIENSSDGIFLLDKDGRIAFCSSSVARILGYKAEELVGYPVNDLFHPDDREKAETGFLDCITGNANFVTCRVRLRHRDHSWRITDGVCSNLLAAEGIHGLVVNFRDVTESAAAEIALRKSEECFAKAFTTSPLPTIIITLAKKDFLNANPAFLKMFGYESSEVVGHTADELGLWVEPHARETMLKALEHSPTVEPVQTKFRTKSGEIRDVVVVADILELDGVPCLLGITQDVTETKRLEAKFLQAQKMEAVGRLAGGIAHDFNNLLMIMGCSADLLQENRLDSLRVDKFSQQIRDAVDKAARLTRQLLAFSRQQVLQPSVLDLNGIINDLVKMMSRLIGEDIEVELTLDPGLGRVEVDRGQTEQVIMNLAVNARDAMPDGGKLTVTTTNIDMDSDHPYLQQMGLAPGSYVMLSIIDTGIGMSAETQSHMFEPFFTTKELGKGTGLGLSTVFGIVKQSNGAIWVQSEPGEGTAFHIYLPRIQKAFAATTVVEGAAALDGKETILLAEDDDALRHLFVDYLRSKGYRVIEAVDGPNALHASEEEGTFHVLVTDMIMPGFGGHKLADLLLARCPDIPVIFLSGYTDRAANIQEFKFLSSYYLQKPFSMDALARAVRTALRDRRG